MEPLTWEGPRELWPAVVAGRVINAQGQPEAAVLVRIEALNAGASTRTDGTYRLVVPGGRLRPGQSVTVTASRAGLSPVSRTLTLSPGAQLSQNFHMAAMVLLDLSIDCRVEGREPISNTQHEGEGEGGTVKVHGDHLVVLRGGWLFTVDIGGGRLQPVDAVNAFAPGRQPARWYNELLVSGGNVVVISYGSSDTTEINLFRIDARGRLTYRSTYLMRSDEDNSWGDYASRIVAGRLVIYAPVKVGYEDEMAEWMPAMRRWRPGAPDGAFRRTLPATRIYRPGRKLDWLDDHTLHTVTTCGLARGELDCESSAVLAPEASVFYVSPTAVYLWVDDEHAADGQRHSPTVYRLPLDGADPTALGVEGSPRDHLSFLESADGFLNVLVRGERVRRGTEWVGGDVRLLRVPRDAFSDGRRAAPRNAYRDLPGPPEYDRDGFVNRFAGQHLLYGEPTSEAGGATLYVVRWRDGRTAELPLNGLKRIEAMGSDAVVVWKDTADLHLAGIRLDGEPRVAQRYVHRYDERHESPGESFFYRQDGPHEGVIGLPFTRSAPEYEQAFDMSTPVLFLRNEDHQFRPIGELSAQVKCTSDQGKWCWYIANHWQRKARPVFLRGRVFALPGYEIVEGEVVGGRIREVARAHFPEIP